MVEYIEREAVKQKIAPAINEPEAVDFWEWQCSEIDDIPAADVRPVVRCRDCYFRTLDGAGASVFTGAMAYSHITDDWFCAGGIRK